MLGCFAASHKITNTLTLHKLTALQPAFNGAIFKTRVSWRCWKNWKCMTFVFYLSAFDWCGKIENKKIVLVFYNKKIESERVFLFSDFISCQYHCQYDIVKNTILYLYLSIHLFDFPAVIQTIPPTIHPFINLFIHPSVHPSIRSSILLFIIHLCVFLTGFFVVVVSISIDWECLKFESEKVGNVEHWKTNVWLISDLLVLI